MAEDAILRDVSGLDEPDILRDMVSYRIRLLQIAAYKVFEQRIGDHGSAPRYYGLLKLVETNPGIPQTRLAEAIFLDRSSLVPILETLSREGWIERRRSDRDKRVRRVFLTREGAEKLKALETEVMAHEAMMTRGFSTEEKAQLLGLLMRLGANLRDAHEGRP